MLAETIKTCSLVLKGRMKCFASPVSCLYITLVSFSCTAAVLHPLYLNYSQSLLVPLRVKSILFALPLIISYGGGGEIWKRLRGCKAKDLATKDCEMRTIIITVMKTIRGLSRTEEITVLLRTRTKEKDKAKKQFLSELKVKK